MIDSQIKDEAVSIGNDSWELINFMSLPENASKEMQIDALNSDKSWQRDHIDSVASRIEELIQEIES